jgi:D-arabinose 1-dehydrogenase-like Zn-dependent alcohol dehydrogenase
MAAQTALRDVIGKTMLSDMLEGRDKISAALQLIIDQRTEPWGINVISVEVKDVLIPSALEDAMSMQAQAERERQARVILGESELQVAAKFGEAAVVDALSCLREDGVVAINAIHLDQMPAFDYDKLLWGERQIRSVANMTRDDARDFLRIASDLKIQPRVTAFALENANDALLAVKDETETGSAVIVL